MSNHQDTGSRGVILILAGWLIVATATISGIYLISQRKESGDPYFASRENLAFHEIVTVKNIRRQIAEDFVTHVVKCISPPLSPGEVLTEQQVNERVRTSIENYSRATEDTKNHKCEARHPNWTFEAPCGIKINKSSSYGLSDAVNLGELTICQNVIASSLHTALGSCTNSSTFSACLVDSIMSNAEIRDQIDKTAEILGKY